MEKALTHWINGVAQPGVGRAGYGGHARYPGATDRRS